MGFARDYIIYSIGQNIPMGQINEKIKKNYYVNIGKSQGIKSGTILDVYRNISKLDPYKNKKRYNYLVPIGQLKVVHPGDYASITQLKSIRSTENSPLFEFNSLMIGDKVNIHIK